MRSDDDHRLNDVWQAAPLHHKVCTKINETSRQYVERCALHFILERMRCLSYTKKLAIGPIAPSHPLLAMVMMIVLFPQEKCFPSTNTASNSMKPRVNMHNDVHSTLS
jgi:hypothetical protein